MQEQDMLACLVAQAEAEGGDIVMIRAIIEEASTIGANRTLDRLGLSDTGAVEDVKELRELLRGWRDAKKAAGSAALGWIVRLAVRLLLLGIATRVGLRL
ncbi:MAG TPA: DUF6127 family protein [Sphingobium sp.]|uniref:DUF6127 family protein n=1 Tax=Sphingobium sp. TaxID=1912891 RepID=UPI002ED34BDB